MIIGCRQTLYRATGAPQRILVGGGRVALVLGLCVAMSSSVVVVNITRSVTRRTNKVTEMSLLGWSLLQDLTGVIVGALVLAFWNAEERDPLEAIIGLGLFSVMAIAAARLGLRSLAFTGVGDDTPSDVQDLAFMWPVQVLQQPGKRALGSGLLRRSRGFVPAGPADRSQEGRGLLPSVQRRQDADR